MARVLLTGVAGFIGSHLGEALLAQGWSVRGVDAFTDTYPVHQKRANLVGLAMRPGVELVVADLARADLDVLLQDVEAVVHLAGEPGVPASWGSSFTTYVERNIVATQRLLEAVTAAGVTRFVYASSSSVYGPEQRRQLETCVTRPLSPYGASKLAGECLVGAYAMQRGLSTVALRYFSVYGPRQRPDMAAHRFIEAALDRRPITVYGDGGQARDFTYVGDVVAATVAALTAPAPSGVVLNVAHGEPVEVRELIALVTDRLGTDLVIDYRPHRAGDTARTEGGADAAFQVLGWRATTALGDGLAAQVDWHLRRRRAREGHGIDIAAASVVTVPAQAGPPAFASAPGAQ